MKKLKDRNRALDKVRRANMKSKTVRNCLKYKKNYHANQQKENKVVKTLHATTRNNKITKSRREKL
jgi:hypothetical protein